MSKLGSLFGVLKIEIERWSDHLYRRKSGLPLMRRSIITPQLYLGGQYNLKGFSKLKELGVTAVVNMRTNSIHKDFNFKDFKYLHLPTPDLTAPSIESLKKGTKFIKSEIVKGGKVYIHCRGGEGRGPSMIIAYLMSTGLTYEDAFMQVKKVRVFIRPTKVQINRLKEFETQLQIAKF